MAKIIISKNDGVAHLPGSMLCMFETACGYVDSENSYLESKGELTCEGCIDVVKTIIECMTLNEIKKLKEK